MKFFNFFWGAIKISFSISMGAILVPMLGWFFIGDKIFGFMAFISLVFMVFIAADEWKKSDGLYVFYIFFPTLIVFSICEVVFVQRIYYYFCGYGDLFLDESHASAVFFDPNNNLYSILFFSVFFLGLSRGLRGSFERERWRVESLKKGVVCSLLGISLTAILSTLNIVSDVVVEAANLCLIFFLLLMMFFCLLRLIFWWSNGGGFE